MGRYLDMINSPADVKLLTMDQLQTLAQEIRDEIDHGTEQERRAPRPEPRRGRVDHRPAPRVSTARRTSLSGT